MDAFLSIREIVKDHIIEEQERKIVLKNSAGRTVVIALAADPDVRIQEEFSGKLQNKVAIEIKGGTDKSNAHNRAGEAEKSHQKARNEGFRDFWTIIATKGLDTKKLKRESPTTNSWFDAAQVLGREGEDWHEFRNRLAGQVGIPLATEQKA
ncbi:MAG: XcyI family restriction endonuclease [Candidatus Binatia bacterium]